MITIKAGLQGQSKSCVANAQIESDELTEEQIIEKLNALYAKLDSIATSYAMRKI